MHRRIVFNIKEGMRNLRLLSKQSLKYFSLLLINHLFLVMLFSLYVNLNYMKELSVINTGPFSFSLSLLTTTNKLDGMILLLFVISLIFLLITIHTNMMFIKEYLKLNSAEIRLILKLKGSNNLVRTPIIYSAFFINLLSIILVLNGIRVVYGRLFDFISTKSNLSLKMLNYNDFNISLLVFLFLITSIIVIFSSYFLFWNVEK